jgi:hypothetical protein
MFILPNSQELEVSLGFKLSNPEMNGCNPVVKNHGAILKFQSSQAGEGLHGIKGIHSNEYPLFLPSN